MTRERLRPALLLVLIAAAFWIGQGVRARTGIAFSAESLRDWVAGFGATAPAIYLAALFFRPFLLIPSVLLLPAGGAYFGLLAGTVLGAAGVTVSAVIQYWLARGIGRDAMRRRFGRSLARVSERIEATGPIAVALVTGHPTGPMTAAHWGAALASVPILSFTLAAAAGAFTRSFLFSFFGASLVDSESSYLYLSSALLAVFFLLPLASRDVRGALLGRARRAPADGPEASGSA